MCEEIADRIYRILRIDKIILSIMKIL